MEKQRNPTVYTSEKVSKTGLFFGSTQIARPTHNVLSGRSVKDGDRVVEDGIIYEYEKDPVTGNLIKRAIGTKNTANKFTKGRTGIPEGLTEAEIEQYKKGKRNTDSDSEYSYKSAVSEGGTRHVRRHRKRDDGTYSDGESYHSSQDEDGETRRRQRRRERRHVDSAHSYYSVVSDGGTRQVMRRRRREDGTYSAAQKYESPDEEEKSRNMFNFLANDNGFKFASSGAKGTDNGSSGEESEYSYYSERSEGGTRYELKKRVYRDLRGKRIGYGKPLPAANDTDTASLRPRLGSFGESVNGEEYANRRLAPITSNPTTMIGQFISDVNTIEQEEPDESSWPDHDNSTSGDLGDLMMEDGVDLSKMTDNERRRYLEERARLKVEREKLRQQAEEERKRKKEQEKLERLERQRQKEEDEKKRTAEFAERRISFMGSARSRKSLVREKPKSMVTYERGAGREATNIPIKADDRDIGLAHDEWGHTQRPSIQGKQAREKSDLSHLPAKREVRDFPTFPKIPPIHSKNSIVKGDRSGSVMSTQSTVGRKSRQDVTARENDETRVEKEETEPQQDKELFDYDPDGKLRLGQGTQTIDINKLSADDLKKLGIDPNLSKTEIARKLKDDQMIGTNEMFGNSLSVTEGGKKISTKRLEDYDTFRSVQELAKDPDFDVSSIRGPKRMNILFTRGGQLIIDHMKKVLAQSKMRRNEYAQDLDEKDSSIDFLSHYRLVDPGKLEGYAKAYVVEDNDYDTALNYKEFRLAIEGISLLQDMTKKQLDYVLKVLHIDDATQLTFRMFAVISALCERVTMMDPIGKHLLEICNLADIERKLDLYNAMFYHNVCSDRDPNYITSESLKIELIAGGLSWGQQQFIMKQMEPNNWGEISFLDYICYIPLFMSMHDNICDNPLDMSDRKYTAPPRKRPPSTQRDINPLGNPLKKSSTYLLRKQALDLMSGRLDTSAIKVRHIELLEKYATAAVIPRQSYSRQSNVPNSDPVDVQVDMIY